MKLFEVRFENYKSYFVEAMDYNDAYNKVNDYVEFKIDGLIDEDGSMVKTDSSKIKEIKQIADFVIR